MKLIGTSSGHFNPRLYETNITDWNSEQATIKRLEYNEALLRILKQMKSVKGVTYDEKRQLLILSLSGGVPLDASIQKELAETESKLVDIYSVANVDGKMLEPDLTQIMQNSRNPNELLHAFIGMKLMFSK